MNFLQGSRGGGPGGMEYNILLMGETGAGKSTTINAFANYLKYGNFDEAMKGDFLELISSKFELPDPNTGETMTIKSGKDDNECDTTGKSSTQAPKAYVFDYHGSKIRLIDTPGVGDTDGIETDEENFDKILCHLHNIKNLHGILFLLKSTETRATAFFKYCISELLTQLHKSASRNIVFCFTFSRNSYYAPGDGYNILKAFLADELADVQFKLNPKKNCFFIDNEAYRFLVAKKCNYPFPPGSERTFKESWDRSVESTNRMMEYIINLPVHDLENTLSLNGARKLIYQLAEPMVQLQQNINANISHLQDKENELLHSNENKMSLAQNLHIEVDDLEQRPLPYPSTVCTTSKCTEAINYQGEVKINYKTRCHEDCQLSGVSVNTVGHHELQSCWAMGGTDYCAQNCGCSWQEHMHITCEYGVVKRTIIDTNREMEIRNADDAIEAIEQTLESLKLTVEEYKEEMAIIEDIGSKFAYILVEHSTTPYNKFIEPYLDLLIREEEKKLGSVKNYPAKKLETLKRMKANHLKRVDMLTRAINNRSQRPIEIKDIYKYRDRLVSLKHSGPQFQQMIDATDWNSNKNFQHMEVSVDVAASAPRGRNSRGSNVGSRAQSRPAPSSARNQSGAGSRASTRTGANHYRGYSDDEEEEEEGDWNSGQSGYQLTRLGPSSGGGRQPAAGRPKPPPSRYQYSDDEEDDADATNATNVNYGQQNARLPSTNLPSSPQGPPRLSTYQPGQSRSSGHRRTQGRSAQGSAGFLHNVFNRLSFN